MAARSLISRSTAWAATAAPSTSLLGLLEFVFPFAKFLFAVSQFILSVEFFQFPRWLLLMSVRLTFIVTKALIERCGKKTFICLFLWSSYRAKSFSFHFVDWNFPLQFFDGFSDENVNKQIRKRNLTFWRFHSLCQQIILRLRILRLSRFLLVPSLRVFQFFSRRIQIFLQKEKLLCCIWHF